VILQWGLFALLLTNASLCNNSNPLFLTGLLLQILKPKLVFSIYQFPAVFLSWHHRLRKPWRLAGTSGISSPAPLLRGGSATAAASGPCPLRFAVSPRMETPQNHRMVGVGRDLWRSSTLTPLLQQVHLKQAAQDFVQAGYEYFQRRRLHNPSGQPIPLLLHPQSEEVLPHVQTELPMLQFVPVAPCPDAGHH